VIRAEVVELLPANDLFDSDPIPLTPTTALPDFPTRDLPAPICAMVEAVSVATQTDPSMAGTSALTALSACTGGRAMIEIRSGWREPLNIYGATVAAPGERKSAVQAAMLRPVLIAERELVDKNHAERAEAQARKDVAERAAEHAKQAAAKATDTDAALAEAISAVEAADQITVPPVPRIIADDVTPEAAASLMAEQGGAIAIFSAEGGIFATMGGRYSGVPNLDVFLKGHAGDPLKVDRKGRPPEYIERPALTLGLMIQPEVLTTIGGNRQFSGRGLLARILFAMPISKVGYRTIGAPPADPTIVANYERTVSGLAAALFNRDAEPVVLTLTATAHTAVLEIETAVEHSLREHGDLRALAEWGSKYVGALARIAGILHFAEHGAKAGAQTKVTTETILTAHRIGGYYRACAVRAFATMSTDQGTADAIYLLGRIVGLRAVEASERDIFNAARSRFKTKTELQPALERLADHGFIALIPGERPTGRGRPPSPRYALHPSIHPAETA
jgi:hypothetical protein